MEITNQTRSVILAAVLGLGGGSAGTLADWGGLKEKIEKCEQSNEKQWAKLSQHSQAISKLETSLEIFHPRH